MKNILTAIDQLSIWTGKISSLMVLIVTMVVLWEVLTRYLLHQPTSWAAESMGLGCALLYVLGAAWVMQADKHVKIETIYEKVSPRVKAGMDAMTYFFFLIYTGMMTWATGKYALNSLAMGQGSGTPWNPPIYPIKLALAFGFLILVVQGTAKFIRDLYFMTTGNKL